MRDAGHDGELLVGVGQLGEEGAQILEARDAVPLAAHDQRRHRDFFRVDHRQLGAHVHIGSGRHRGVELEDVVREGLDHALLGGAGVVAVEDRMHEGAVDRPAVLGQELGQPLAALRQRRAAFTRPHHGVERQAGHHLGMTLGEQRGAQRPRRDAVDQEGALAAQPLDVGRGREAVVGAEGDRRIVVASLFGAAVALHVDAPGVVAVMGEPFHHRRIRAARDVEIEGWLARHRRAVHEQHDPLGVGRIPGAFVPQEELHVAFLGGPVLGAGEPLGERRSRNDLVHAILSCSHGIRRGWRLSGAAH